MCVVLCSCRAHSEDSHEDVEIDQLIFSRLADVWSKAEGVSTQSAEGTARTAGCISVHTAYIEGRRVSKAQSRPAEITKMLMNRRQTN